MHTDGPWQEDDKHTGGARAIIGDGQQLVALVYGKTTEERDANAQVICAAVPRAQPLSEWHEDLGPVIWWRFCRDERPDEASWIGTPLDDDWPGYHTHWTPHPPIPSLQPTT